MRDWYAPPSELVHQPRCIGWRGRLVELATQRPPADIDRPRDCRIAVAGFVAEDEIEELW